MDARMPMPALVFSMLMPNCAIQSSTCNTGEIIILSSLILSQFHAHFLRLHHLLLLVALKIVAIQLLNVGCCGGGSGVHEEPGRRHWGSNCAGQVYQAYMHARLLGNSIGGIHSHQKLKVFPTF
jgi:hypothetical protein